MPHKHTRREKDDSAFNLPPSEIAKPLPVTLSKRQSSSDDVNAQRGKKRKRGRVKEDDAPRAFKRLMAFTHGNKPTSGLDNGPSNRPGKTKIRKELAETPEKGHQVAEVPKIRPGERLHEFAARVDAALPLGGLVAKTVKNGKDPLGMKVYRTKKERKMHKLYDQWREEEAKIQAQREEDLERAEEEELENEMNGVKWRFDDFAAGGKKKKKGRKSKYLGEVSGPEDDPWDEIKKRRNEAKVGLHDVAQAPPELNKSVKKKLTVRGSATVDIDNVPKAAGSLRRREELQGIRQDVVDSYRKLMSSKRPGLHG